MKNKESCLYYIYTHFRKDKNEIFYVGMAKHAIGNFSRANVLTRHGRNDLWYKMYIECDEDIIIKIEYQCLTLENASKIEADLVNKYGRFGVDAGGTLSNKIKGGHKAGQYPIKIAQYDRDGNYIKTWPGMREAAEFYGVNFKAIWQSMNKNCLSCGSQWVLLKDVANPDMKIPKYTNKEIYQYDRSGNFIKSFISAKKAAESVGVGASSIRHCILGNKPTSGGYKWSYSPPSP